MKGPGIAVAVLSDLKKKGGPGKVKDEMSAKASAARDVMQAIKDEDEEAFEASLTSFVKACYGKDDEE